MRTGSWMRSEKTGNEKFIRYNEESYAVMLDKRSVLIDKMEEDI